MIYREDKQYIRLLELMSIITEEYGEAVKEINNYLWKDGDEKFHLSKAIKELDQIVSPLLELQSLLKILEKGIK